MMRNRIGIALLACFAVVSSAHAQGSGTKTDAPGSGTKQEPALRIQSLDGKSLNFSELIKGKPALLIFWATWCPSCREQAGSFQQAFDRFGRKGLQVMAINIGVRDTPAAAKQYAKEKRLTLPMYFDGDQSLTKAFKVAATPGVLLLDRGGKVVSKANAIDEDVIVALLAGKPIPEKKTPMPAGSGSTER